MAKKTRDQLDAFFEDGDTPDASEFGHLIDSMLNLADTGDQEIAGDVKILGTMSASVVGAEAYAINGLSLETTVVTENQITGSNIFGSQSAAQSLSGVTSHSFFGPIHQSSSGAHSGSHFLTPVSLGTTFDKNPIEDEGLYIESNKTIALSTSSLSQAASASLLISKSAHHLAFDSNEIHHFGDNLFITAQGIESTKGNIIFRTSVNPTSIPPYSMMISSSGVVGIGTGDAFDAPLHTTLVVSGNISSSGGLDLDGNITASGTGPHTFGGAITASIVSASGPIYASSFVGSANFSGFTLLDDEQFKLGTGTDFKMFHQASDNNTFLIHGYDDSQTETDLAIRNISTDGDIVLQSDDGTGTDTATYLRIDGGDGRVEINKPLLTLDTVSVGSSGAGKDFSAFGTTDTSITMLWDSSQNRLEFSDSSNTILTIGNSADLGFYHDGSNSYIEHSGVGDLIIRTVGTTEDLKLECTDDLITDVKGQMDLRSDSHIILDADRNNNNTGDLFFRINSTNYFHTDQANTRVEFNKEIVQNDNQSSNIPIIPKNVAMSVVTGSSGTHSGVTQVRGGSGEYLSVSITAKSKNPKWLINTSVAVGSNHGGINKILIKARHWNGAWVDGSHTGGGEWFMGAIGQENSNGVIVNATLNGLLYEIGTHTVNPGNDVSFSIYVNPEKSIYFNRAGNSSTHGAGIINSFMTVEEIPQPQ